MITTSRTRAAGLVAVLAGGLAAVAGCNIMKGLAFLVPDPTNPAQYTLPKNARVLIMLDERDVSLTNPRVKPEYVDALRATLVEKKLVAAVVPSTELDLLERNDPLFGHYSIRDLGRKCGANYVIYAELKRFNLKSSPTDPTWTGSLQVAVKVIDCETGNRVWPDASSGELVEAKTPQEYSDAKDFADQLSGELAKRLADKVAKLFYEHEAETVRNRESNIRRN